MNFKTLKIDNALNVIMTNPPCFWNSTERNKELKEAYALVETLKSKRNEAKKGKWIYVKI